MVFPTFLRVPATKQMGTQLDNKIYSLVENAHTLMELILEETNDEQFIGASRNL
jgi:hypothetical protein